MERVRKALMAGFGAAVSAFVAAMINSATEGTVNRDEVLKALGTAAVAGVTIGWATYKVRNAGTINGSTLR